jgi:monovalent cation:H+ antiporter, CPA1 family
MHLFDILAVLLSLAAAFSWINHRFIRLPTSIGLMLIALLLSLGLLIAPLDAEWHATLKQLLEDVHFEDTVLHGMLGFLLFAGALHVDLHDLARHKWVIATLASASVVGATLLIALGGWLLFGLIGLEVPFIYCLLFGALISPTDPIAVLGILKNAGAPASLNTKITGESLFNDGVAVVLFLSLLGIATGEHEASLFGALGMLGYEVIGGALLGFLSGGLVLLMLSRVDDYQVEILLTLALATGGYALAEYLHLSAPIAIVVAGLMIGNHGRRRLMSDRTRQHLDDFWELIDEILNAVLFVLIGLEILVLELSGGPLLAGALAIPLVLAARALSVGLPIRMMRRRGSDFAPGTVTLLTWAGLRGGISIALALSLPAGETRDILLSVTYVVVVFSILVQGLTLGPLVRIIGRRADRELAEVAANADFESESSASPHN